MANPKPDKGANPIADVVADTEDTTRNYDAEEMKTAISKGEEKAPNVNLDADYEAAKSMSTGLSGKEADQVVAPQMKVSQPNNVSISTESQGYAEMAKEVGHAPASTETVTDDLVEKAIEKGRAGA